MSNPQTIDVINSNGSLDQEMKATTLQGHTHIDGGIYISHVATTVPTIFELLTYHSYSGILALPGPVCSDNVDPVAYAALSGHVLFTSSTTELLPPQHLLAHVDHYRLWHLSEHLTRNSCAGGDDTTSYPDRSVMVALAVHWGNAISYVRHPSQPSKHAYFQMPRQCFYDWQYSFLDQVESFVHRILATKPLHVHGP